MPVDEGIDLLVGGIEEPEGYKPIHQKVVIVVLRQGLAIVFQRQAQIFASLGCIVLNLLLVQTRALHRNVVAHRNRLTFRVETRATREVRNIYYLISNFQIYAIALHSRCIFSEFHDELLLLFKVLRFHVSVNLLILGVTKLAQRDVGFDDLGRGIISPFVCQNSRFEVGLQDCVCILCF